MSKRNGKTKQVMTTGVVDGRRLSTQKVWLLNADFMVLGPIDLDRAVGLLFFGGARPFKVHPTRMLRSKNLLMPFPEMVISREWVHKRYSAAGTDDHDLVSRRDILERDGYVCGYCGCFGDTIDHIYPESKGGQNTWANLITACKECNNEKDNRTPEEAGMKLLWNPKNRDKYGHIQAEVWRILQEYGDNWGASPFVEVVPEILVTV